MGVMRTRELGRMVDEGGRDGMEVSLGDGLVRRAARCWSLTSLSRDGVVRYGRFDGQFFGFVMIVCEIVDCGSGRLALAGEVRFKLSLL